MLVKRTIADQIMEAASEYPAVAIVGPRQSGKTTLAQTLFPSHVYISLEDYDVRELAHADPRRFLGDYPSESGIILDEIQHAPKLLSYIQTIADREKKHGFFIVTGSQNFLVNEAITQTLAGRMAVITLLPLSISELKGAGLLPEKIEALVFKGSYPKAHAENPNIKRLYANYLKLYVERDVRTIKMVADLNQFQTFMRLLAGRIGQIVDLTSLGNDCGITQNTVKSWISILEASYVIFPLHPYFNNFGKRLIKSPKIYFIDTGIACSLLKINSAEEVASHSLRGGLVESLIISDILKQYYNIDEAPRLYFWRDKVGHEVDCIIDQSQHPIPVEIKSGQTIASDFFNNMMYWKKAAELPDVQSYLIYAGDKDQSWPQAQVLSWQSAGELVKNLEAGSHKGIF